MDKIIILTNMEQQFDAFRKARDVLSETGISPEVASLELVMDTEPWTDKRERSYREAALVLFIWMGTGLQSKFLKQSAECLRAHKVRHLFRVADPGDDELDFGITPEENRRLQNYISFGGLDNYRNLWLWLVGEFGGVGCQSAEPCDMPWNGIYHPRSQTPIADVGFYRQEFCLPERPTVAIIFSREDWLWGHLASIDAVIETIERHGCNAMAVFCSRGDADASAPGMTAAFERYFFDQGQVCIDALINTFVFSLTVSRFLELEMLMRVGVPMLQAYNLYNSREWWQNGFAGMSASEISYGIAMPEFDGILHSVPMSTREETENGSHERQPLSERIDMLVRKAKKWAIRAT